MPQPLAIRVATYIRRHKLLRAGDRVAVAVSGGADSVALLRLLLELRQELGPVLSVAHFNHKIRGPAATDDEAFVRELAARHGLECFCGWGDVPAHAAHTRRSLETAARELRYRFFGELLAGGAAVKVATAHTLDDQAETVLLRLLRGAGTQGLVAIYPRLPREGGAVVRPLLGVARGELEEYLRATGQPWREDATNRDLKHSRNRVRHLLLPLLEREFNPAARRVLAETAEVARAEEELLSHLAAVHVPPGQGAKKRLDAASLAALPLALKRRVVRAIGKDCGVALDFSQVEKVLALAEGKAGSRLELPGEVTVEHAYAPEPGNVTRTRRELVFFNPNQPASGPPPSPSLGEGGQVEGQATAGYEYRLRTPGEVVVPELGKVFRARFVGAGAGYNRDQLLKWKRLTSELRVRNWRPGDRFWPAHTKSAKKVKELLQDRHITGGERRLWPVVTLNDEVVWLRGFAISQAMAPDKEEESGVLIEEVSGGNSPGVMLGTPDEPDFGSLG